MATIVKLNRNYALYGSEVRDFEKDPDISNVLAEILCFWAYPVNAIIGCKFTAQWLAEGEFQNKAPEDLDLIFEMCDQGFFEIITRNQTGAPQYGGWLISGKSIELTDEIVENYRVIVVEQNDGLKVRHEYVHGAGYQPVPGLAAVPLSAVRRAQKRKAI